MILLPDKPGLKFLLFFFFSFQVSAQRLGTTKCHYVPYTSINSSFAVPLPTTFSYSGYEQLLPQTLDYFSSFLSSVHRM